MAKFLDTPIDSISSTTPTSLHQHNQTKNKTPQRSILKSSSQTTSSMISSSLHPSSHHVITTTVPNSTTATTTHHPEAYYIDRAKQILLDEEKLNEIRKDAIQLSKQPTSAGSSGGGVSASGSHHFFHHRDEFIIGANLSEHPPSNTCGSILIGLSWFLMVIFFPFSLFMTLKVVQEYELVFIIIIIIDIYL